MLADMKARVEAIEYEIERRKFEPEKIVYEFIGNRFKPAHREAQEPHMLAISKQLFLSVI